MSGDGFLNWLQTEKRINSRSSKDVLSRLKRGERFLSEVNKQNHLPLDEAFLYLGRNPEFAALSSPVKSQIKRSFKLKYEFLDSLSTVK